MVFEHNCVLAVCAHKHPKMMKIHPLLCFNPHKSPAVFLCLCTGQWGGTVCLNDQWWPESYDCECVSQRLSRQTWGFRQCWNNSWRDQTWVWLTLKTPTKIKAMPCIFAPVWGSNLLHTFTYSHHGGFDIFICVSRQSWYEREWGRLCVTFSNSQQTHRISEERKVIQTVKFGASHDMRKKCVRLRGKVTVTYFYSEVCRLSSRNFF